MLCKSDKPSIIIIISVKGMVILLVAFLATVDNVAEK